MDKPIDIFRAGTHTAMSGVTCSFSETDLDAMARVYDPALHEAPIVVGHPAHDAPAYGWVRSLARAGEVLQAVPDQVDASFAELVAAGRFKKISASFYAPGAPNNPTPETYYLRHVGFLGAQPPAVKGLRTPAFADGEAGVVTLEFGDWSDRQNASLWRRLREFFIEQWGADKADAVLPSYSIESLEEAAREPDPPAIPSAMPAYSEHSMTQTTQGGGQPSDDLAARATALAAQQADLDAREAKLREAEAETRRRAHADFAERLVSQGRLLPRERDGLVAFMEAQAADQTLVFGEGDGAFSGQSLDWFKQFLARQPVQVDFSERSGAEQGAAPAARFKAPPDSAVDPGRLELLNRALAYQEAHQGTSYADAVMIVSQQTGA